jgi:hypothetical protein
VGLRGVLDTVVKRKIPSPRRKSNPRTPSTNFEVPLYVIFSLLVLLHASWISYFPLRTKPVVLPLD